MLEIGDPEPEHAQHGVHVLRRQEPEGARRRGQVYEERGKEEKLEKNASNVVEGIKKAILVIW